LWIRLDRQIQKEIAMIKGARFLIYLGIVLVVSGVILRFIGYNQDNGFLQSIINSGITPRAFLMAGAVCGIFSIAMGVLGLTDQQDNFFQEIEEDVEAQEDEVK
jgi:hypothetical protein